MGCRLCKSTEALQSIYDFGPTPWENDFQDLSAKVVNTYPKELVFCTQCNCVQLKDNIPKEVMFSNHTYLSGVTKSLDAHFAKVAPEALALVKTDHYPLNVLDIGSNDGTQLKHYKERKCEVLGVEPADAIAKAANSAGIPTIRAFYNLDEARKLGEKKFNVINASGVLYHLEELHSVMEGIQFNLAPGGVFVIQFTPTSYILENTAFDYVYHEHLLYYSLRTLERLLGTYGLELNDAYKSDMHGWMVAFASFKNTAPRSDRLTELFNQEDTDGVNTLEAWKGFVQRMEAVKKDERAYLSDLARRRKVVYFMGAPVKGVALLHSYGVIPGFMSWRANRWRIVERNQMKIGKLSPLLVEVEDESKLPPPDVYYVLAWNFKKEILERNKDLIAKGVEFHFPLPRPSVLNTTSP